MERLARHVVTMSTRQLPVTALASPVLSTLQTAERKPLVLESPLALATRATQA